MAETFEIITLKLDRTSLVITEAASTDKSTEDKFYAVRIKKYCNGESNDSLYDMLEEDKSVWQAAGSPKGLFYWESDTKRLMINRSIILGNYNAAFSKTVPAQSMCLVYCSLIAIPYTNDGHPTLELITPNIVSDPTIQRVYLKMIAQAASSYYPQIAATRCNNWRDTYDKASGNSGKILLQKFQDTGSTEAWAFSGTGQTCCLAYLSSEFNLTGSSLDLSTSQALSSAKVNADNSGIILHDTYVFKGDNFPTSLSIGNGFIGYPAAQPTFGAHTASYKDSRNIFATEAYTGLRNIPLADPNSDDPFQDATATDITAIYCLFLQANTVASDGKTNMYLSSGYVTSIQAYTEMINGAEVIFPAAGVFFPESKLNGQEDFKYIEGTRALFISVNSNGSRSKVIDLSNKSIKILDTDIWGRPGSLPLNSFNTPTGLSAIGFGISTLTLVNNKGLRMYYGSTNGLVKELAEDLGYEVQISTGGGAYSISATARGETFVFGSPQTRNVMGDTGSLFLEDSGQTWSAIKSNKTQGVHSIYPFKSPYNRTQNNFLQIVPNAPYKVTTPYTQSNDSVTSISPLEECSLGGLAVNDNRNFVTFDVLLNYGMEPVAFIHKRTP